MTVGDKWGTARETIAQVGQGSGIAEHDTRISNPVPGAAGRAALASHVRACPYCATPPVGRSPDAVVAELVPPPAQPFSGSEDFAYTSSDSTDCAPERSGPLRCLNAGHQAAPGHAGGQGQSRGAGLGPLLVSCLREVYEHPERYEPKYSLIRLRRQIDVVDEPTCAPFCDEVADVVGCGE